MKTIISISFLIISLSAHSQFKKVLRDVQKNVPIPSAEPSLDEITRGLKQALEVGTGNAVTSLNKPGGYLKNPVLKIPFPPDAKRAATKLRELGMGKMVDDFVNSLNEAAEAAAIEAKPIFVDAITTMSFEDAKNILQGSDNAATEYFKSKTTTGLTAAFSPKIKASLDQVQVTKYWSDITSKYNMIPGVKKIQTDLPKYATEKALQGLFLTIQEEEKKIRVDPAARVSDLLKKVFGSVKK